MKTVIIFDQVNAAVQFVVLDGDYRHLSGIYINCSEQEPALQDELSDLMFESDGKDRQTMLDTFPTQAVRDGAEVIVAGFLQ